MSESAKNWFDRLEAVLTAEADLAGLLRHGSMVGSGREFFVRRVLKSILPPALHIGSGRVVDSYGSTSKQIDIIIYDSRCPVMEIESGIGLYFVEGVIATIEVKSTLTTQELKLALENCASVTELNPVGAGSEFNARVAAVSKERQLSVADAREVLFWNLMPRSYIFAFNSTMTTTTIADTINAWYDARRESPSPFSPTLPRVIAAPDAVALQNDGWFKIEPGDAGLEMCATYGAQSRVVMGVWPTTKRFGWLALHLISASVHRLGIGWFGEEVYFSINRYLPAAQYFEESLKGQEAHYVFWTGQYRQKE